MEMNKQNLSNSAFFDTAFLSAPLKKSTSSDYFLTSSEVLHNTKNLVLVLSQDGRVKNMSASLSDLLGYSEDELLAGPVNNLLAQGKFVLSNQSPRYYFNSVIRCKGNVDRTITWRLVPDLFINAFVFVGWEA
jgi:PAS domain-containing protein